MVGVLEKTIVEFNSIRVPKKKESQEKSISIVFQVLHRKTEEAAMATKRLKELLESRKSSGNVFSEKHFTWFVFVFS